MRIFDINGVELTNPNLNVGYLVDDKIFIQNHPAEKEVREQGHFEIIKQYPNGGKDVKWIVDVPYKPASEEWDEYENISRYILYTVEELEELNKAPFDAEAELEKTKKQLIKTEDQLTETQLALCDVYEQLETLLEVIGNG